MSKIGLKTVSYLPDWPFRFKRKDDYFYATKESLLEGDDFQMTMTLFEFDGVLTCWVGMDMARCDKGFYEVLWDKLNCHTDKIKKNHFFVSGTHTHSGPVFTKYNEMGPESFHKDSMSELAYHCGDVVCSLYDDLIDNLTEFTTEIKTVWIRGCYSNRNGLDEPCDKNVTLIRFNDLNNKPIGMWFSMNCHSTVTFPKNEYLCSDLVGHVYKKVAEKYSTYVMPMCGAQGDTSTRLTRRHDNVEHEEILELKRISDDVYKQIVNDNKEFEPLVVDRFEISEFSVSFEYDLDYNQIDEMILKAEAEAKKAEETGDIELIRTKKTSVNALRNKKNIPSHVEETIVCHAFNLGELKFAAISGELVASLGLKIVRHNLHDHRMVVCYINDRACGYLVEKEEYGKNFESIASIIPVGIPEVLTDMAVNELDKFDVNNKLN